MTEKTNEELAGEVEILKRRIVELESEKNRSDAIITAIGDGIIIQDEDHKLIYQNQILKDIYGDMTGEYCFNVVKGRKDICEDCPVEKTFFDGKIQRTQRVDTENGVSYYDLTSSPLKDSEGKIIARVKIIREITEQKRNEETLNVSEARYRQLHEGLMDAFACVDMDGRLTEFNKIFQKMLGYETEELLALSYNDLTPEKWHAYEAEIIEKQVLSRGYSEIYEKEYRRKDGSVVPVELRTALLRGDDGKPTGMWAIIRDITQRKYVEDELQKSNRQQQAILNNIPDIAWLKDKEGRFIAVNKPFEKACGVSREELLGRTDLDIWPIELAERYMADDRDVMISGKRKQVEEPLENSEGNKRWIETIKTPIYNNEGEIIGTTGIARDITERKSMEEKLQKAHDELEMRVKERTAELERSNKALYSEIIERKWTEQLLKESLTEKEILLREIHHRVKNNMQVISGLLMLHEDLSTDKKVVEMLKDSQNRISSMALIHEKFYRSENLSNIDFKEYVDDLVFSLLETYRVSDRNIDLNINVENFLMGIDQAIPCGLIINELVSNSLKHAFPGRKNGEIKVSLRSTNENTIELLLGDNGIGIPEDMDFRKTESLGLHIVNILVENQLHGEITMNRENGTEFNIKFRGSK